MSRNVSQQEELYRDVKNSSFYGTKTFPLFSSSAKPVSSMSPCKFRGRELYEEWNELTEVGPQGCRDRDIPVSAIYEIIHRVCDSFSVCNSINIYRDIYKNYDSFWCHIKYVPGNKSKLYIHVRQWTGYRYNLFN